MYAGDYDDVTALKNISDKYGIAVLVVHHVRKLKDVSDPFNEVSGPPVSQVRQIQILF